MHHLAGLGAALRHAAIHVADQFGIGQARLGDADLRGGGIDRGLRGLAGARRVYAVEATSMARHARALVEANGAGDVVQVIQGTIETAELPEKVRVCVCVCCAGGHKSARAPQKRDDRAR